MKILLISGGDSGGNCYFIADAINKYTPHHARAIRMMQTYLQYPHDLLCPSMEEIQHWMDWADVIHGRDFVTFLPPTDKPRVITFSGRAWRKRPAHLTSHWRSLGWFVTVSTPDMPLYCKKDPPLWIPNPREKMSPNGKHERFTVCQAPTFRERKNTAMVESSLDKAGIDFRVIENKSYFQCLEEKSKCHALADQWDYGYGNNAIEAWSLEIPVISGAREQKYIDNVILMHGYLPYVLTNATQKDIAENIKRLRDDEPFRRFAIARGLEYFHTYHHSPAVAKMAIDLYERLL
jgi:hypothetical protein